MPMVYIFRTRTMGMSARDINRLEVAGLDVLGWDLTVTTGIWATWLRKMAENPDLVSAEQDLYGPDVQTLLLALLDATQFMFGIQVTTTETLWEPPPHNRPHNFALCECLADGLDHTVPFPPLSPPVFIRSSRHRQFGDELTIVPTAPPMGHRPPSPPPPRFLRTSRRRRFGDELVAVTAAPPVTLRSPPLVPPSLNLVRPPRPRRRTGDELYPVTETAPMSPQLCAPEKELDQTLDNIFNKFTEGVVQGLLEGVREGVRATFDEAMLEAAKFCRIQAWVQNVNQCSRQRGKSVTAPADRDNVRKRYRSPTPESERDSRLLTD